VIQHVIAVLAAIIAQSAVAIFGPPQAVAALTHELRIFGPPQVVAALAHELRIFGPPQVGAALAQGKNWRGSSCLTIVRPAL